MYGNCLCCALWWRLLDALRGRPGRIVRGKSSHPKLPRFYYLDAEGNWWHFAPRKPKRWRLAFVHSMCFRGGWRKVKGSR